MRRQAHLAAVGAEDHVRRLRDVGAPPARRQPAAGRCACTSRAPRASRPPLEERDLAQRTDAGEAAAHPDREQHGRTAGREPGDAVDEHAQPRRAAPARSDDARPPGRARAARSASPDTAGAPEHRLEADDGAILGDRQRAVRPPRGRAARTLVRADRPERRRPPSRSPPQRATRRPSGEKAPRGAQAASPDGLRRATAARTRAADNRLRRRRARPGSEPGEPPGQRVPLRQLVVRPRRSSGVAAANGVHRRNDDDRRNGNADDDVEPAYEAASTAASACSCSPNRARGTNRPTPGFATTSPPSTITWPRRSTVSTSPTTSVPS